jgi:hypothetical protein
MWSYWVVYIALIWVIGVSVVVVGGGVSGS